MAGEEGIKQGCSFDAPSSLFPSRLVARTLGPTRSRSFALRNTGLVEAVQPGVRVGTGGRGWAGFG